MKKSLLKTLISTVGAGVALLSIAFASWSMPPGGEPPRDPAKMVSFLSEKLELTQTQEKDITALLTTSRAEGEADRQRMHTLRKILQEQEQNFNEQTARQTADEIGQITARMVYMKTSTAAQISGLLTEEQRQEMAELQKKRESRHGKRRDHPRGDSE